MSDDDDMFARWSRRKRRVAEEEAVPVRTEVAVVPAEDVAEPETPEAEAELLRKLELPVPESLVAGDDFSRFMRVGVPEFLRKRALRVLWRSNPVLANLDGLNDYDDDFNSPELNQKVVATAYKIGRGILRDEPVPEILQDNDKETDAEAINTAEREDKAEAADTNPANSTGEEREEPDDAVAVSDLSLNPRRMRFQT